MLRSGRSNSGKSLCPVKVRRNVQLFFSDITGLRQFRKIVRKVYNEYRLVRPFVREPLQLSVRPVFLRVRLSWIIL